MSLSGQWTREKLMVCLKRIVHPELVPSISREEYEQNYEFLGEAEALSFLDFIYEQSQNKLLSYGPVDEMMENFKIIDEIPEFITSNENVDSLNTFALSTPCILYQESDGEPYYTSRSISAIIIFSRVLTLVQPYRRNRTVSIFFQNWLTAYLNKTLRRLKDSYDFIPRSSLVSLMKELKTYFKSKPEVTIPDGTITVEWFHDLRRYYEQEDLPFLFYYISQMEHELIPANEGFCKERYAELVHLIENIKTILDRHMDLFNPLKELTIDQKPVIRRIHIGDYEFLFAQEVNVAIRQLMKNRTRNPQFSEDLIMVESEEERTNGIFYGIEPRKFEETLKEFGLCKEDFVILKIFCDKDYRGLTFPIISSYGIHCMPAKDAFDSIIYYLSVFLRVFQRSNNDNLQKVMQWIENMMDPLFVEKPVFYLVDIREIDDIIDRARRELCQYLTEPEYEVPLKESYDRDEIYQAFVNLTANCTDKEWFTSNVGYVLNWMTRSTIYFENIFYGYNQMIIYYLLLDRLEISNFRNQQVGIIQKLGVLEKLEEEEASSGSASPRQEESDQKKEVQQPSYSTENNENKIQKVREKLNKLRINENELNDELEKESEDLEQKVDSENEQPSADDTKYMKFKEKVNEYRAILEIQYSSDSVGWSRYSGCRTLKKLNYDFVRMEDFFGKYVEKPEKEFEE